ncbi:hypothetical protein F0562_003299 [Nyssa sinensis]|uniref:RRM domain-containing protein n=1 Tax=Nyssa sinensis TaxID=561372 RepID=A0A5J5BY36_9ASTE|nr:hypothetical protein F0562_003299 [Nyssa sinensis]
MAKIKIKKRKLVKKAENKVEKKLKKKKLQKTLAVPKKETNNDSDNDSSGPETESEKIENLLEPYTKDQLIDFIIDAAIKDAALFNRIRDTADRDVSHRKIFVYGLGWDTTRETLTSAFKSFGEIEDCNVITDRNTGKAKGFGFILFKTRQGATKALKQPKKKINNRITSCQLASVGPVPPPQSQDTAGRKIYVSNVQADVDPEKLRAFFAKFGEIETGPIGFDMQTGKSRGFALFVYQTLEGARKVLEEPYKMFEGHQLHCRKAADGKNKMGAASVTTAVQPVQAPVLAAMAAAQNLALFSQHPSLNPTYSGLLANPNAGLIAAAGSMNPIVAAGGLSQGVLEGGLLGSGATGLGGYGGLASQGFGSFGGRPSVLGAYGSSGSTMQGLQYAYPSSQIGQPSSARAHGVGGSFSGYPSYT